MTGEMGKPPRTGGSSSANRQGRIPQTLQAVFLASNRGNVVDKPPPERVGYKVFFRNWIFRGKNDGGHHHDGHHVHKSGKSGKSGKSNKGKIGTLKESTADIKKTQQKASERHHHHGSSGKHPRRISFNKTKAPEDTEKPLDAIKIVSQQPTVPPVSPQGYLDSMIRARGYSTRRYKTLQTGYHNKPTALQQASYDVHLIDFVRAHDTERLRAIMSCGLSPNPCNNYGESLVHMICRRGDYKLLEILLSVGTTVQVADDYGRTPLHDACWAAQPSFETVEMVMKNDIRLFHMTDCRGAVPLSYVRKDHWRQWIAFLEAKKDEYWPTRNVKDEGEEPPPPLTFQGPNTRPLPDPEAALTIPLAQMVSSGKMEPEEAQFLKYDNDDDDDDDDDSEDSSAFDSDDESFDEDDEDGEGSYDSDEDGSNFSWDEDEMADILNSLAVPAAKPLAWSQNT